MKRKVINTIIKFALHMLFVGIIIFIIVGLINIRSNTGVFGYTARVVISESMEPTIEKNTLSIVKIENIEDIKVNDIICFKYDADIIHRVVGIEHKNGKKILYTKGDNNTIEDNIEITEDMLVGKIIYTFNTSYYIFNKYVDDGKLNKLDLYKDILVWSIILIITVYIAIKFVKFIVILIKAFSLKTSKPKSIRTLERDIEELYLIKSIIEEIDNNTVKNEKETRFEYISNKVSRIRTEYAICNMHKNITYMRNKVKNCYCLDNLFKRVESLDKENDINEIDNHTT